MSSYRRWLPALALLVLSLTWGYTWVLAKQGLTYAPPFAFAAERCVGGALTLILVLKLMGRPLKLVAPGPTLAIGLTQVAGFMVFQTWALVEGGPGKTAVLIFTMPIWTLLMAWPLLGERVRGKQWLAAASTLIGLLLIIEPWDMHSSLFSKFLGLMAALCWATGTILIKRLRSTTPVDLLTLTAWQMILGAVPLVVLSLVVTERPTDWTLSYMGILALHVDWQYRDVLVAVDLHPRPRPGLGSQPVGARHAGRGHPVVAADFRRGIQDQRSRRHPPHRHWPGITVVIELGGQSAQSGGFDH
jgi:drug/metabolite transporter (DMT)-like permease